MIKIKSEHSVSTTLDRLAAILEVKGIGVVARVDHAAAASKVDMELRPTQLLIFGNPKLGTPLIQSNQLAGLQLPVRVLAWEDEAGQSWLGYHSPQEIAEELQMTDIPDAVKLLAGALEKLTTAAAQSII